MKSYFPYHPELREFEKQPQQKMGEGMLFQHFHTGNLTLVRWEFKKGVVIPKHHHMYEQVTWFERGSAKIITGVEDHEKEIVIKAGQIVIFPSNTPHEFHILEDCIDIDVFCPPRQDWIDGKVSYYQK